MKAHIWERGQGDVEVKFSAVNIDPNRVFDAGTNRCGGRLKFTTCRVEAVPQDPSTGRHMNHVRCGAHMDFTGAAHSDLNIRSQRRCAQKPDPHVHTSKPSDSCSLPEILRAVSDDYQTNGLPCCVLLFAAVGP